MIKICFTLINRSLGIFLFGLFFLVSCKNKQNEVGEFNDKIVLAQEAVINSEISLVKSLNNKQVAQIDSNYNRLLSQIISSDSLVEKMEDPDPEIGFKKAAQSLFSDYKTETLTGYKSLVELSKIPDSLFSNEHAKKFEEISATIFIKLNTSVNSFMNVQNKLATKYKFTYN